MVARQSKGINVVTVFLEHNRKILLLRRSHKVRTMQAMWAGISGYVESKYPLEQTLIEIKEETGLSKEKVKLICIGQPLEAIEHGNPDHIWIVHPYLFHSNTNLVKIDWEHDEFRWINPNQIQNYKTVPKLKEAFESVYYYPKNL
jgi:8-oxo-dGTP diphosphatase